MHPNPTRPDPHAALAAVLDVRNDVDLRPHPGIRLDLKRRVARRRRPGMVERITTVLEVSLPVYRAVGAAAAIVILAAVGRAALTGPAHESGGLAAGDSIAASARDTFLASAADSPRAPRDSLVNPADSLSYR